jgi:hypothetical protein
MGKKTKNRKDLDDEWEKDFDMLDENGNLKEDAAPAAPVGKYNYTHCLGYHWTHVHLTLSLLPVCPSRHTAPSVPITTFQHLTHSPSLFFSPLCSQAQEG